MTTLEKLTYTVEEAAELLGIGRSLCYEMVRQSRIPSIKLGGKWIIPKEGVRKMLAEAGQGETVEQK